MYETYICSMFSEEDQLGRVASSLLLSRRGKVMLESVKGLL